MKKMLTALIAAAALPTLASAGEVYGKITSGGIPVDDSVTVSAKCGAKSYDAVATDKTGSYHLVIAETGKCTLTITLKGQTADVSVLSYDDAAQADLILEAKDGKLSARRK